jgi:hypothetical protein
MRLLIGLLTYLVAVIALVGGAAAFLLAAAEPAVTKVPAQQDLRTTAPRIQMWLDRKAEDLVYLERRKAAALAEAERAKEDGMRVRSRAEQAAFALARDEDIQAVERESAARMRDNARREARKQTRQLRAAEQAGPSRVVQERTSQYYPDLHGRSY